MTPDQIHNSDQIDNSELKSRILALIEGEDDVIAKMATVTCEVFHNRNGFDWVGFYRVTSPQMLKIGPYQGGHGCLQIPFDRGVCGAAAREEKPNLLTMLTPFPGISPAHLQPGLNLYCRALTYQAP